MGKNLDPKCKQCRRIGEKLFLKGDRCLSPKCTMVKKNYPPGIHGQKGFKRSTEYGLQLNEKQKAKKIYYLNERQFQNYFRKATIIKGDTGINFLRLLELRLDNIVYKLSLAKSRIQARAIINHGHIMVNNKKVDKPSYQVKINDIISIKENSLKLSFFKDLLKTIKNKKDIPPWLGYIDDKLLKAKVVSLPTEKNLNLGIDTALIIEFYSK